MKRFHYDIKENKNIKKHYNVDLKEGFMNLEGELYQLYGIIVHRVIFNECRDKAPIRGIILHFAGSGSAMCKVRRLFNKIKF